jgi:hypothetical protein
MYLTCLMSCLQVAVHFMGSVAEALLQLPEVPLRNSTAADGGPPTGLWLTVGLLAADGFALQLRLKKADRVRTAAGLPVLLSVHLGLFYAFASHACIGCLERGHAVSTL